MTKNVQKILIGSTTFLDVELEELIEAAQAARQKLKEDQDTLMDPDLDDVSDEDAMAFHHTYSEMAKRSKRLSKFIREHLEEEDNN